MRKTLLMLATILCVFLYCGFYFRAAIVNSLLVNIDLSSVDVETARKFATNVLDAADVPDGDLSIPSNKVHSKRYIISKWQRSAVGSSVVIFGTDPSGNLCVVLGRQRGVLRNPQGYMEVPLPKED